MSTEVAISDLAPPPFAALSEIWPDVPQGDWKPFQQRFPNVFGKGDLWHNHVGCFLIQTRNRLILVDTGIGRGFGGAHLDVLAGAAINPSGIDTVLLTHLHMDHVGWNLSEDGSPTFPEAR